MHKSRSKIYPLSGELRLLERLDTIFLRSSNNKKKLVCLQELKIGVRRIYFRLGYHMIGVKPRMRGKWTWGESAPMLTKADFEEFSGGQRRRAGYEGTGGQYHVFT